MTKKYKITVKQGNKVVWEEAVDYLEAFWEIGMKEGQPAKQNGLSRGDIRFASGVPYDEFSTDSPLRDRELRCEFCDSHIYGDKKKQKQVKLDIIKKTEVMIHMHKLAKQAMYPWMRFRTWRFWQPWEKVLLCIGWTFSRLGRHDIHLKITGHIFKEPGIVYTYGTFFKNNYAWPSFKTGTSTDEILKSTF